MRCYLCGKPISPDEEKECRRKAVPYKMPDGRKVKICECCWLEVIEESIHNRYKLMGRRWLIKHEKDKKEIGLF